MWIVLASLRRPYTVWVGMLLVAVLGVVSYYRTPTDILPPLKSPVVVVFASYRGMPAPDMEQSVIAILERSLTRCDHLDHIESRSLLGIGIIRIHFRSDVDPDVATSQVATFVNAEMQNLPPGMQPPTIFKYDASAIPVGQLVVRSDRADDKELLDLTETRIRDELAGIEGLASAQSSAALSARCRSTWNRGRSRPTDLLRPMWRGSSMHKARFSPPARFALMPGLFTSVPTAWSAPRRSSNRSRSGPMGAKWFAFATWRGWWTGSDGEPTSFGPRAPRGVHAATAAGRRECRERGRQRP